MTAHQVQVAESQQLLLDNSYDLGEKSRTLELWVIFVIFDSSLEL